MLRRAPIDSLPFAFLCHSLLVKFSRSRSRRLILYTCPHNSPVYSPAVYPLMQCVYLNKRLLGCSARTSTGIRARLSNAREVCAAAHCEFWIILLIVFVLYCLIRGVYEAEPSRAELTILWYCSAE